MTLWLDDIRDPAIYGHAGALWAKTAAECIKMLEEFKNDITYISLDHDLFVIHPKREYRLIYEAGIAGTGKEVAHYIVGMGWWPTKGVNVHSANSLEGQKMIEILHKAGKQPLTRRWASGFNV